MFFFFFLLFFQDRERNRNEEEDKDEIQRETEIENARNIMLQRDKGVRGPKTTREREKAARVRKEGERERGRDSLPPCLRVIKRGEIDVGNKKIEEGRERERYDKTRGGRQSEI